MKVRQKKDEKRWSKMKVDISKLEGNNDGIYVGKLEENNYGVYFSK